LLGTKGYVVVVVVVVVFASISIGTIWVKSSMCIKPLTNTPFPYVDTTIPSPHSDSLKIYALVLDE
jgi:hypothetical protein